MTEPLNFSMITLDEASAAFLRVRGRSRYCRSPRTDRRTARRSPPRRRGRHVNLPDIPDSIPFERVQDILTSLGIGLDEVTGSGIRIALDAVECTRYSLNPEGLRYATTDEHGEVVAATHHIYIPVVRATVAAPA